jgi:hypothetical protein
LVLDCRRDCEDHETNREQTGLLQRSGTRGEEKIRGKRRQKIILGLVVSVLVVVSGLLFSGLAAQALLSHDLGLLYPALARVVLDRLPGNVDRDTALAAFRDYVYLTVRPILYPPEGGSAKALLNGNGWCNHVADIFIRLIEPLDVKGYVVFLYNQRGKSPHTLALVTPNHPAHKPVAFLRRNARVYDSLHDFTYGALWGGPFASPNQVCHGNFLLQRRNWAVSYTWFCRRPKIVRANRPLSRQGRIQRWSQGLIRTSIPTSWMRALFRLVIGLDLFLPAAKRAYYLARIDHLYLECGPALRAYSEIIKRYPKTRWAVLARRHRRRLKDMIDRFPPRGDGVPGR